MIMDKNEVLYQLTVEDFQNIALENIERELSDEEVKKVADWVADRIPWYDLIDNGITELIGNKDKDYSITKLKK